MSEAQDDSFSLLGKLLITEKKSELFLCKSVCTGLESTPAFLISILIFHRLFSTSRSSPVDGEGGAGWFRSPGPCLLPLSAVSFETFRTGAHRSRGLPVPIRSRCLSLVRGITPKSFPFRPPFLHSTSVSTVSLGKHTMFCYICRYFI